MPLYFFNTEYGGEQAVSTGVELADTSAAWQEAIITGGQILKDFGRDFSPSSHWKMVVNDEAGAVVFELRFSATAFEDIG